MRDPNLWHLNRRSVSGAVALGLFVALLPLPLQMLIAGAIAIWLRVNLPISVALVWISNPLTMPPIFFTAYQIGRHLLGEPRRSFHVEPTWTWLWTEALPLWKPLVLGSVVMASVAAIVGYLAVRIIWRLAVLDYLALRRKRRLTAGIEATLEPSDANAPSASDESSEAHHPRPADGSRPPRERQSDPPRSSD